jgi:hypothetical protein
MEIVMINQNHLQLQNLCLQEEIAPYRGSSTGVVARRLSSLVDTSSPCGGGSRHLSLAI